MVKELFEQDAKEINIKGSSQLYARAFRKVRYVFPPLLRCLWCWGWELYEEDAAWLLDYQRNISRNIPNAPESLRDYDTCLCCLDLPSFYWNYWRGSIDVVYCWHKHSLPETNPCSIRSKRMQSSISEVQYSPILRSPIVIVPLRLRHRPSLRSTWTCQCPANLQLASIFLLKFHSSWSQRLFK